ncbi:MAG: cytochrome ubiquinol oxidase subunit I [Deltaproteobacteria bacterium]|nr:cytochrome ubiquinol oxidase subunit I [Deltaproteobacteria bacterium]
MNYPVWELYFSGGGFWMVIIAVVHVYVSHFAVGGGLFLVLTEMKAYRENDSEILAYTKSHSKFFLLLTMVFAGITGVGIWFTISLLSPTATSTLVHIFVFGFATEWVCFLVEIIALFLYYYKFEKISRASHLKIGWLYFIFAWLSLFFINAIIDFMLTPGDWLETKSFWDGFFNPSMVPALCFRTALALFLAGIFGFITAVFIGKPEFRQKMIAYCSKWLIFPLPFMALSALWYLYVLPENIKLMILSHSPEIVPAVTLFSWLLPLFLALGLIMRARIPARIQITVAFTCLLAGLVYMGAFEWIREAGRRPYLIYGHTYSTAVRVGEEDKINQKGILQTAKWVENRNLTQANTLEAGREIFRISCMGCHSIGGPINDILPLTKKLSLLGMQAQLNGQGKILTYMPPFMGTKDELHALARYIVSVLHVKTEQTLQLTPVEIPITPPTFDEPTAQYVLLAWSDRGMHAMTDSDRYWSFQPPASSIYAQLIRRGETPEIVTGDVDLVYAVEKGHENPSAYVDFWKVSGALMGKVIPADTGLTGNTLSGNLKFNEDLMAFSIDHLPVVPYKNGGSFNPYPLFQLEARDSENGKILAQTALVTPVSTEMGCRNCHGGPWRFDGKAGIGDDTAADILAVHDRISKTDLLSAARKGQPRLCQSCHAGNITGIESDPERLSLSASMHGFHANYLSGMGDDACSTCHTSSSHGMTRGFRGIHHEIELTCTSCHLSIEDHALSLLAAEKQAGKERKANVLMKHLTSQFVDAHSLVEPRTAWTNQPDCMNCHVDFEPPETDQVEYNTWTDKADQRFRHRTDDAGLMCMACHGAAHAVYPTRNPYGEDRDNLQPLQYQGTPYPLGSDSGCRVCHTIDMEDEIHHPNMLGEFRNTR